MNSHRRPGTDRACRRSTTSRWRTLATFALLLALLAAACGSDKAAESTAAAPAPTAQVDVLDASATDIDTGISDQAANADPDDGTADLDAGPDYNDDELEELLETEPNDTDVLDAPEPEPLETAAPEAAIDEITVQLDETNATESAGSEILDRVEPLDDAPTVDAIGIREGRRINEAGEAIRLDDAAALSCGNTEIALTALDDDNADKAVDRLLSASTSAANTSVVALHPWAPILEQSAADVTAAGPSETDVSPLLAFLTACTQGGYEL